MRRQTFMQAVAGIGGPLRVVKPDNFAWPGTYQLHREGERFPLASGQIGFIMRAFEHEVAKA